MDTYTSTPEFVVCTERPIVSELNGRYVLFFIRNPLLTCSFAEDVKRIASMIADHSLGAFPEKPEWKLPDDEHSRIIEYNGIPNHYSRIRFVMMKLLIEAEGQPVPFSLLATQGWGYHVDRTIIEKHIYTLNLFLEKIRVPKVIHARDETIFMDTGLPGRLKRPEKSQDETLPED